MNHYEKIFAAAFQLNACGKKPSLGLLKSKVGKLYSTREIIEGLQQWKQNPELGKDAPLLSSEVDEKTAPREISAEVLEAIAPLVKRIDKLEQQLKELLEKQV